MKQHRRMGAEDSQMRMRFVDAVEELLRDEGYHAVSARKVAAKAGLKPQLLYYYFRTIDDLFLAVVQRHSERRKMRLAEALAALNPLRAIWELSCDPTGAAVSAELTSMANHREAIRAEIVRSTREFRVLQIESVSRLLPPRDDEADYPAAGIVMIAAAVARTIILESTLGIDEGHEEALKIVEVALQRFSAPSSS